MVVAKLVDLLIEPLAHQTGYNLYRFGEHIALTNLWYQLIPTLCGPERFEALLTAFLAMLRDGSTASVQSFYEVVDAMAKDCTTPDAQDDVGLLLLTEQQAIEFLSHFDSRTRRDELDPAGTCLVALCVDWGREFQAPFRVIHDDSSVIRRWSPLLKRLMRKDRAPKLIGYDDRQFELPIRATGITLVDSASSVPVQVADILAGAVGHVVTAARKEQENPLRDSLEAAQVLDCVVDSLTPIPFEELLAKGPSRGKGTDPAQETRKILFGEDTSS